MVEATVMKLTQLKNKNGPELSKVYEELEQNKSSFRGVKVTDKQNLRIQFQNCSSLYLQQLDKNLENRFDSQSMKNLQLMNSVLNPSLVPKNIGALEEHSETELQELIKIYGSENGLINGDRTAADYYQMKVVLKSLNCSLTDACTCTSILLQYKDIFPDFAVLAIILLISPVTSVTCERGFSVHNKIKTKGRATLKHETVTKLMHVKEEGPSVEDFDPKSSVKKFSEMRKRRK